MHIIRRRYIELPEQVQSCACITVHDVVAHAVPNYIDTIVQYSLEMFPKCCVHVESFLLTLLYPVWACHIFKG